MPVVDGWPEVAGTKETSASVLACRRLPRTLGTGREPGPAPAGRGSSPMRAQRYLTGIRMRVSRWPTAASGGVGSGSGRPRVSAVSGSSWPGFPPLVLCVMTGSEPHRQEADAMRYAPRTTMPTSCQPAGPCLQMSAHDQGYERELCQGQLASKSELDRVVVSAEFRPELAKVVKAGERR
jgi:hypothetical protein